MRNEKGHSSFFLKKFLLIRVYVWGNDSVNLQVLAEEFGGWGFCGLEL